MHPKFYLTGVQTHDFQIMVSTFHVPETLILMSTAQKSDYSPGNHHASHAGARVIISEGS